MMLQIESRQHGSRQRPEVQRPQVRRRQPGLCQEEEGPLPSGALLEPKMVPSVFIQASARNSSFKIILKSPVRISAKSGQKEVSGSNLGEVTARR